MDEFFNLSVTCHSHVELFDATTKSTTASDVVQGPGFAIEAAIPGRSVIEHGTDLEWIVRKPLLDMTAIHEPGDGVSVAARHQGEPQSPIGRVIDSKRVSMAGDCLGQGNILLPAQTQVPGDLRVGEE